MTVRSILNGDVDISTYFAIGYYNDDTGDDHEIYHSWSANTEETIDMDAEIDYICIRKARFEYVYFEYTVHER